MFRLRPLCLMSICALALSSAAFPSSSPLPKDVKPIKITARGEFSYRAAPGVTAVHKYEVYFWNVGEMLDQEHGKVFIVDSLICKETGRVSTVKKATCRFTGGPRGAFIKDPDKNYADMISHPDHAAISGGLNGLKGNIVFDFWCSGKRVNGWGVPLTCQPADAFDGFPDPENITVTLVRGSASVLRAAGGEWIPLDPDDPVPFNVNDQLKTSANTRVQLQYPDGSLFRVKSDSIVTLLTGGIRLQVGEAWFNLQKQGRAFQFVTPTSVVGVLGTTFAVSVGRDGTSCVSLYQGKLQVSHVSGGKGVVLKTGQSLRADAAKLLTPVALTADAAAAWDRSWQAPDKSEPTGSGQTFTLTSSSQGFPQSAPYPVGDFDLRLALSYVKPGKVMDTAGLNAAPPGTWSLAVQDDGRLAFNLWDGRSWRALVSAQPLPSAREIGVQLIRRGQRVQMLVAAQAPVSADLPTPLSGTPFCVGDFRGDEAWGSKYNIHQGMVGVVRLQSFGAPSAD